MQSNIFVFICNWLYLYISKDFANLKKNHIQIIFIVEIEF